MSIRLRSPLTSSVSSASIRVSEKLLSNDGKVKARRYMDDVTTPDHSLPAPGVLSITGERTELVVWESVVKVTVVGMVEHGFDALPEK